MWLTRKTVRRAGGRIILHQLTECGVRQEIWEWTPHTDSSVTKDGHETIPKEWLLRPCFKLCPRRRHQATLWFWRVWFLCGESKHYWTALTSCDGRGGRYLRTNMGCNWWGTIWRCSNQVWNTGTLYQRHEQQARGVVNFTY